ncbi:hypothetical protein M9458_023252, partial [Cirrhinus mrigala]
HMSSVTAIIPRTQLTCREISPPRLSSSSVWASLASCTVLSPSSCTWATSRFTGSQTVARS